MKENAERQSTLPRIQSFFGSRVIPHLVSSSQLMAKEPMEKLGFKDLVDPPTSQTDGHAKS